MPRTTLREAFDSTFHGKFSFDDFLSFDVGREVEKVDLRDRQVFKVSAKLKRILRFLNSFIFDYADVNESVVHSYRKGRSTYTALSKHRSSKFFYKTDINKFFESFTPSQIKSFLVENLNSIPIEDVALYRDRIIELVTLDGRIPIGFSTSPSITNSLLYSFDNALLEECKSVGVIYTRYSDDIILSGISRDNLSHAAGLVESLLKAHCGEQFSLNGKKTKFTHIGNRVKILGMVLLPTGEISVDAETKKSLEVLLHFYSSDMNKFSEYLEAKFEGSMPTATGRLNYVRSIDSAFIDKLRKKYGNFVVDHFIGGAEG